MKVPKIKRDDFACRCSDKEQARSQAVLEWAYENLSERSIKVGPENLATFVAYALEIRYRASIDSIFCDQWCAVTSSTGDMEEKSKFHTFIQCDHVEDGLAFTLKAYYDKYGDKRE